MSRRQLFIIFLLVLMTSAVTINSKETRQHREMKRYQYGVSDHQRVKRNFNKNCPPPPGQGILEVKTNNIDLFTANRNKTALDNIRFMCGQALVMRQIPNGWKLEMGNDGSLTNATTFTSTPLYVPVCCSGYVRNDNDICVPKCKRGCKDGVCISPGICACYQGYAENSLGECVLKCPCKCQHGKCQGDVCDCNPGYYLDPTSQTCTPVCTGGCVNADCTAPDICTCHSGYKKKKSDPTKMCSPHCGIACRHGRCISPLICECDEGYTWRSEERRCIPKCVGCQQGECLAPYKCRCYKGYARVNEVCQPVCSTSCVNATCIKPDTCECLQGYVPLSSSACEYGGCNPKCQHGDCTGPNRCSCHDGYFVKEHNTPHICYDMKQALLETVSQFAHGHGFRQPVHHH